MSDLLDDLRARWDYHPTFRARVVVTAVALVLAGLAGWAVHSYSAMSPACQRDFWDSVMPASSNGNDPAYSSAVASACRDSGS